MYVCMYVSKGLFSCFLFFNNAHSTVVISIQLFEQGGEHCVP